MREIKYRIPWYNGDGSFCGFTYWGRIDHKNEPSTECFTSPGQWGGRRAGIDEQFTGLYDKNDKEIYEGDIVVIPGEYPYFDNGKPNYTATVEWVFSGFQAVLHCINKDKAGISDGMNEGYIEESGDFEVIGNIHENPELLEASK